MSKPHCHYAESKLSCFEGQGWLKEKEVLKCFRINEFQMKFSLQAKYNLAPRSRNCRRKFQHITLVNWCNFHWMNFLLMLLYVEVFREIFLVLEKIINWRFLKVHCCKSMKHSVHQRSVGVAGSLTQFHFQFYHYCHSTPARHSAKPYQPKRHPNAQEKLKQYILLIKL